jgi:hypothetical protein
MDNILEGKSSFSLPQVSLPHEPSSSRPCSSGSDKAFNFVETKITYEILKPVKTDDREQIPGLCELMEYKDISYWDRVNTFGISAANWFEVLQEPYRSMQKIWAQMRATPSSEARLRDFTTFLDVRIFLFFLRSFNHFIFFATQKQIRNLPWVLLQMIVEYNNYSLDYVSDQIPKFYISFNHLQHRVKYSIARIGGPNENITNLDHFELTPMEFMQSLGGAFSADLHKMCADCTDCAKLISLQESITPLLVTSVAHITHV